jgi:Ca2+/Na+ antiporter
MGQNKYDLDWSVWGNKEVKNENGSATEPIPSSIGRNWSSNNQQAQSTESEPSDPATAQSEQTTFRLLSAELLPDNETDFLQPCAFQVKADRNVNVNAHIELFSVYNTKEISLNVACDVAFSGDTAKGNIKLEYNDPFYNDYFGNGKTDAVVDYFLKVTAKGAEEISGKKFQMPLKSNEGVAVQFYEYPYAHESKLTETGIPATLFQQLNEYHATPMLTPTRTGPVLVDDKWIYIFTKKGSGVSLTWECKATADSKNQSFEFVSWAESDRETTCKSYPREIKGAAKNQLRLKPNEEYYLLVSKIQLTIKRIDFYIQNAGLLAKRCLHIPVNTIKETGQPFEFFCTDYLEVVFGLREQFDKNNNAFKDYFSDTAKTERRYLAALVQNVAKQRSRLKSWINYDAVVRECQENDSETKTRQEKKKQAEAHLRDWKLSDGYRLAREEYVGTKENEEAILSYDMVLTSFDELEYLEKEGEKPDSWYTMVFDPESRFTFFRKLETLAAADDFWPFFGKNIVARYLANFGPTKIKKGVTVEIQVETLEHFIAEVNQTITRAKIVMSDLVKNNDRWFFVQVDQQTRTVFIDYEFSNSYRFTSSTPDNTTAYRSAKRKWNQIQENIEKVVPGLQKVLIAIEAVNFLNSMETLVNSKGVKDGVLNFVNFLGSAADLLSSLKVISEQKVTKWFCKANVPYKNAKILASKTFGRINLAGAICDYIGALKDTAHAANNDNYGLAAGYATIALASTATAAGAALIIQSGTATAVAFGLSASTLGLIGIGLFIVGSGIVWYFSESDLKEWAKKCSWAKDPENTLSVKMQIQTLHKLICEFTADCYIYVGDKPGTQVINAEGRIFSEKEYYFTVRVRPGFMNQESSKYYITLKVKESPLVKFGPEKVLINKTITIPASKVSKCRDLQGDEYYNVLRRFSYQELGFRDNFHEGNYSYELTAKLDFKGDGSEMVFDVQKEGKLEVKWNDV